MTEIKEGGEQKKQNKMNLKRIYLYLSCRLRICITLRSLMLISSGQTTDKVQKPGSTKHFRPKLKKSNAIIYLAHPWEKLGSKVEHSVNPPREKIFYEIDGDMGNAVMESQSK
jgi:hypothetical protein